MFCCCCCSSTFDSLRLYHVIDCSGYVDENGYKIAPRKEANKNPNNLYYDNPEQYFKHMKIISPSKKSLEWRLRTLKWFPNDTFNMENYLQ